MLEGAVERTRPLVLGTWWLLAPFSALGMCVLATVPIPAAISRTWPRGAMCFWDRWPERVTALREGVTMLSGDSGRWACGSTRPAVETGLCAISLAYGACVYPWTQLPSFLSLSL